MRSDYISPEDAARLRPRLTPANRLALDVSAATGWRIGDVLTLATWQLKRARRCRGWVTITERKTGKKSSKRVPYALLDELISAAGDTWVFPNRRDPARPRSRNSASKQLRQLTVADPRRITAHSYRKLYAVQLFRRCGDLEKVRKAMGHERPETTLIYATSDVMTAARVKRQRGKRGPK